MKLNLKQIILLAGAWMALALPATAHFVWLEETHGHRLIIRFAEWPNEYEFSPGHLDELSLPSAWKLMPEGTPFRLDVKKKHDRFEIRGATDGDSVQIETAYDVMASTNGPSRKPFFYARWAPANIAAVKPTLNFDIVPTGNAHEFRVYFRGEPLAGVKVTAHAPEGPDEVLTANADGIVHYTAGKPGLYLLTCSHQRETVKGFSNGLRFDMVSHNCSLAWQQP